MDEKTEKTAALAEGSTVGRWKVVRLLGRGGMAEVYEVEDVRLGARYALKLFTYDRGAGETVKERFYAEGRLLAKLDHPRLVRVYDVAEDERTGRPYFVMDLVLDPEGCPRTLADAGAAGADEEQVAMWYEDLRSGLAYIHAKGILHRDLKLQNVLVGPDGHAVLSDFGVAKIFNPGLREELGISAEMTLMAVRDGKRTLMGSVGYMAPEVEMGVAASPQSDWYALGVLIFRLLTGVWCDARTDVLGCLETYNPVWRDILPKLLHSNPAGRACPSWIELSRQSLEEERFKSEQALDELGRKRHAAVRGRKNAWLIAGVLALAAVAFAFLAPNREMVKPLPDFDDLFLLPSGVVRPTARSMSGEVDPVALARADAWVLMHRHLIEWRAKRWTAEQVAEAALREAVRAETLDEELFENSLPGYVRWGGATMIQQSSNLMNLLPMILRQGAVSLYRLAGNEEAAKRVEDELSRQRSGVSQERPVGIVK